MQVKSENVMELIMKYRNGDNFALERLMLLTYQDLYRLSYGYLKDRMLSEDIVSETYIKLIEKIHTIRSDQNALGYLRTIVINKSFNLLKKRKHEFSAETEWFDNSQANAATEEQAYVRFVLSTLDETEREIILLKSFGFTLHEIVEKTGYTINQVRLLIDKGKKNFLEKYNK